MSVCQYTYGQNKMTKCRREGHYRRLLEEIVEYLDEYFEESKQIRPMDIGRYIQEQIIMILDKICIEDEDPETVEGDYYRESISEYGTVYTDYDLNAIGND